MCYTFLYLSKTLLKNADGYQSANFHTKPFSLIPQTYKSCEVLSNYDSANSLYCLLVKYIYLLIADENGEKNLLNPASLQILVTCLHIRHAEGRGVTVKENNVDW